MNKPVTPTMHAAVDYGMAAKLMTAPHLFGFSKRARRVFACLGMIAGVANATTEHPLSVKPVIPFRTHRLVDLASLPAFVFLPVLTRITKEPGPRRLWLGTIGAIAALYVLTDWDADPRT